MAVYLVHVPMITFIRLIVYGPVEFSPGNHNKFPFPHWAVIVHILVTIGIATFLTFYLEEPARKVLNNFFTKKMHQLPGPNLDKKTCEVQHS